MLRWSRWLLSSSAASTTTSTTDMSTKRVTTAPVVSPAVVRSLYRRLYKEVCLLDADPLAKFLFPQTKELQKVTGMSGPLYVPGRKYVDVLRGVFRDPATRAVKINLAFDALNRLRAHRENVRDKLPALMKERMHLLSALRACDGRHRDLFRAEPLPVRRLSPSPSAAGDEAGDAGVRGAPHFPARMVLGDVATMPELREGTVLVAHPLSSTHVDRRVMMITERTSLLTTAVVLDLAYSFPLSRGNAMFPEVFWGHDVYDGGFVQIGFTMPPTAHITLLHTLEPAASAEEEQQLQQQQAERSADDVGGAARYLSWRKWRDTAAKDKTSPPAAAAAATPATTTTTTAAAAEAAATTAAAAAAARRRHELLCRPLIASQTLPDGTREPTLYLSHVEALPYLATLAAGRPRSSLRVYWGSMRWSTAQIENEVANGHWIAVRVSPSFFRAYDVAPSSPRARFPTQQELRDARAARERRYGADVALPQVFQPDQTMRRRECLWDEIMYSLGGEYAALVGCNNPFAGNTNIALPQIIAPHAAGSSSSSSSLAAAAAAAADDDAGDEGALLAERMQAEAADALRALAAAAAAAEAEHDDGAEAAAVVASGDDDDVDYNDGDDDDKRGGGGGGGGGASNAKGGQ